MSWTPEKEEKLKQYWKKGYSGSQIASMLGGDTTRNAVIGKAHRLKLEARTISKKSESKITTEKNNSTEAKTQKVETHRELENFSGVRLYKQGPARLERA